MWNNNISIILFYNIIEWEKNAILKLWESILTFF